MVINDNIVSIPLVSYLLSLISYLLFLTSYLSETFAVSKNSCTFAPALNQIIGIKV
ncbi:hypothetical protein HMPREF1977_2024 [Capnocytophaga ochracea F0287]|uniref:Uncharacterized protein n=1 Tax=Capnocytophaga ochracea F0287 TaxID=873517 RepID=E4MUG4_CAPOC|nr:hypothetical protein HMPREF1977_2024 [Capnocytophaga ochracea F0287]EJF44035.1 hypothetical protein HMPREF1319_1628 [Capnocytophaga ochracea str. Holt 25]